MHPTTKYVCYRQGLSAIIICQRGVGASDSRPREIREESPLPPAEYSFQDGSLVVGQNSARRVGWDHSITRTEKTRRISTNAY